MLSVMSVVRNRADHPTRRWPNTIAGVVKQKCEFSYRCDGSMKRKKDILAWEHSEKLAMEFITNPKLHKDNKSHFYYHKGLRNTPKFAKIHAPTRQVGSHLFYQCKIKHC